MFDWLYLLQAAFLGIVEGLTEFLPVSSTGHLIVAADLVGFTDATSDTFVVAIQAGAILAVCWYYRMRIIRVLRGLFSEPVQQRLVVNTLVAFLPAAVVGVLVSDLLKTYLFNPLTVATALVIGGLIILYVEHRHEKLGIEPRVKEMDDMDWKDALKVGVAQCLAHEPLGRHDHRRPHLRAFAQGCDRVLLLPRDSDDLWRHGLGPLAGARAACRRQSAGTGGRNGGVLLLCARRRPLAHPLCFEARLPRLRMVPHHLRRRDPPYLGDGAGELVIAVCRWLKKKARLFREGALFL